ncbi:MAG: DUF892 family protein [bacterium]|nr:DUF892 family protein [Myxococcales bacterium]MCB9552648.1 DUF892 family protein [Myxococcales bacterium]
MLTQPTGAIRLTEKQCDKLADLIQLDRDAVEAYEAAINRLDRAEYRARLADFKKDHERHIQELSTLVRTSGQQPPTEGDFKRFLTQGKVVLGEIAGDTGILRAMLSNEKETNEKYEDALKDATLTSNAELHQLLTRNLGDERRHKAWIEEQLRAR